MKNNKLFSGLTLTIALFLVVFICKAQIPAAPFDVLEITHTVKDFTTWKKAFDADEPNRKASGLEFIVLGRSTENPNSLNIVFHVTDLAKAKTFVANPRLKQLMEKNGVITKPEFNYYKVIRMNPDSKENSWVQVTYKIKDFDAWQKVFDANGTAKRAAQGLIDVVLSRGIDDPNIIHLVFDIKDMAKAKAYMNSEETNKLRISAGMLGSPKIEFFNTAE
jgi:quinol monooxygenase YgiN